MSDPQRDQYVKAVCQPGTHQCCRYLTMSPTGWNCEKNTQLGRQLDARVAAGTMRATGDNCEGRDWK